MKIILNKTDLSYPIEEPMMDFEKSNWYHFFKTPVRIALNDAEKIEYEFEDGTVIELKF